jgi:hypothetical protein
MMAVRRRRTAWLDRLSGSSRALSCRGSHPTATDADAPRRSSLASDKVEGTAVYDRQGNRLGSVYNVMIDKY